MEATRSAEWTTEDGRIVKIEVKMIKKTVDDISYADGYNINLGKKTYESTEIKLYINGKLGISSSRLPSIVTKLHYTKYDEIIAKGGYAVLGDTFISKKPYDAVMALVDELNLISDDADYLEVKAVETSKKQAEEKAFEAEQSNYEKQLKNGLCPKCGTYCYGDCDSN